MLKQLPLEFCNGGGALKTRYPYQSLKKCDNMSIHYQYQHWTERRRQTICHSNISLCMDCTLMCDNKPAASKTSKHVLTFTCIRVGSGIPTLISFVFSLKSLQNCAMLIFLYSSMNTCNRLSLSVIMFLCTFQAHQ